MPATPPIPFSSVDPLYTEGVKPVSREREGAESDFSSGIPATGMERLWSLAGATSGNRWQIGRPRKRRNQAKTVATGCDRLPWDLDGKEGVDGSSPSEGFRKRPAYRGSLLSVTTLASSWRTHFRHQLVACVPDVPERNRTLDKDRAFADVLPLERERLTWPKSGVGEDADQGRIP